MVKSMTGYGKAECIISGSKYIVEIRSLNGKNADINLKTSLIPREKEIMLRQYLAAELNRGSIDLFVSLDSKDQSAHKVNRDVLAEYYAQVKEAVTQADPQYVPDTELFVSLLHMPDVVGSGKPEIDEDQWGILFDAIKSAVSALKDFRESVRRHPHPQYDKYLNPSLFRKCKLQYGNIVWGNDLEFHIEDLYSNAIFA